MPLKGSTRSRNYDGFNAAPERNLIRVQMKLLTDVEAKHDQLCEITAQCAKK